MRIPLSCAIFLSLTLAAPGRGVLANQESAAGKTLVELHWFAGSWSCEGSFTASGKAISADLSFEPALENKWLLFRHDDRPPFSYHALSEWGWDDKGQQYISTVQDSTGGIRVFYSPGFSDSRLLWEGKALLNPAAPAERFEFTKNAANMFTVRYWFQKNGQWQAVDASTCTRKAP
jgi:hypothetical protein